MKKAKSPPKNSQKQPTKREFVKSLKNEKKENIINGLYAAIFGGGSFPGLNFGLPGTQQVSQLNPLFDNLRWYFASNWFQQLSEAYCELGMIQTIVDVPVDDGMRGGVEIFSRKLSPEQLLQLQDVVDREDDLGRLAQALKWNRLFGGAGILIFTEQDPSTPLDLSTIKKGEPLEFHAVDMWELYYDMQNAEGYDEAIQDERFQFYTYYGEKIHKSRVIRLKGIVAPAFLRPRLRGWGMSVVEICVRSINQYMKGTNLIYELLDEAKIDVYGIKNLTNTLLSQGGTEQVAARIQMANRQKNFQHALVMDAEDQYTQKSLTFSGLSDVMKEVRYQLAADLRMPLTKLFGMGAVGLNASSEDDIEVYNGMVESTVRQKAKASLIRMLEIRCQEQFGFIPDDLSISFAPMRLMSAEQEQAIKKQKFEAISKALEQGAISLEEFRQACNKDDLLGIQLSDQAPNAQEGVDSLSNQPGNDDLKLDKEREDGEGKDALAYEAPAVELDASKGKESEQ